MVEKSDVVEECSSCVRLKQEIEIARKDQAATLKMIKEKIMSTDKLIKKYQKKCDDFDKQAKLLNDLTTKHENCERNIEILQEQLNHSLEVTEPQKKTNKRLIQEKFIAEETIQELKQKNIEQEEVINHLKHGLQLRDEKDSSWKLEQQLQAKQIEKEKKRVEKVMKDVEKAKEEIKRGKALVREKSRELRGVARKSDNFEIQMKRLKEELKFAKKDPNDEYKRKLSPRELNIARKTRQSAKRCEEKLAELLSDSTKEYNSPTGKKPPLTSIFDEMTKLDVYPLSPVPSSPTESNDSSSESSDDDSSGNSSDSEVGSLGDLGEMLELKMENKDAMSEEAGIVDEDELGCLETESGDEDVENKIQSVSAARNDKNSKNSEQIIEEENDRESIPDSYPEKGQKTPEKRQFKNQLAKASALEDSDTECKSPVFSKDSTIISSEELTSKISSKLSTQDSTAKNMDIDENNLEAVGNVTIFADKMAVVNLEETIEEVDIKNNNLSLSSLDKDLKEGLSEADEKENDHMGRNDYKETCSEKNEMSTTHVLNDIKTESAQGEDSAIKDKTCRAESGAVHISVNKTALDELLSEKTDVKSLDFDNSDTKEVIEIPSKFIDVDDEFADHTTRVQPGVGDGEENATEDKSITENIQHTENDIFLLTDDENTSDHIEFANKLMENELEDDSGLPLGKLKGIRSDVSRKCSLPGFDDKDDTLLDKTKIVNDSVKKFGERIANTCTSPEQQELEMECDVGKKLDEKVGLLDENLDNIDGEETSSPKGDTQKIALNLTVENSTNKTHKQTSMNTKRREKSITASGNDDCDKILELKEEVVDKMIVKGTKRSNTAEVCGTSKRHKRVASTHTNTTSTETIEATLTGTQEQSDANPSTAESTGDKSDTVSTRVINFDSIPSNDKTLSNNDDAKSGNGEDYSTKYQLDLIGDSSELLNKQENIAAEKSSCKTVDIKAVSNNDDSMNNLNKDQADSRCCDETSVDKSAMIMDGSTEEVLEEGETNNVVDTNTSVVTHTFLDPIKDVTLSNLDALGLEDDSSKTMEFEALTSDDGADSSKNNPIDDSNDFTAIKELISIEMSDKAKSKSTISDPSLSSVLIDCFSVFDEEMPVLSPLPPSPRSSRESSPTHEFEIEEGRTLAHFTSLPKLHAAAKSTIGMRSIASTSRVISASSVSQESLTAKRFDASAKYKGLEPSLKLETPRQDASEAEGNEQVEKQKKKGSVQLSVRPYFLSEIQYAQKVFRFLTREHLKIDDVVSRLSSPKTMSNGTPLAAALVKFQHHEDLMPIIIQKYQDRDRQQHEQESRLTHLDNWTPVLSVFEDRVFEMVTKLSQVEHMKGLSTKVISLLSRSIIHSCSVAEEPDKRCVASNCRLLCVLCRKASKLQHMRVLCYDIIRSLYSQPGTVLYIMISVAAVWPTVLASSPLTTFRGLVCLAGESYQPLPCTIQMVLTTWARSNNWVLLGNVLDWMCAWKQVPSGVLPLQQLAEELVKLMKDPLSAQLMHGKDGNPILSFGLYEVIKALELVTCVLGWAWLNNILVSGYLWDILARWVTRTQPGTNCTDTTTSCLNDDSSNDGSKAVHPSLDSSLSTSGSKNKEETQGTTTPCLNDDSCNDGSKAVHPSLDSCLSTSDSNNNEETQRTTTPCLGDGSCNDGSEAVDSSLSTSDSKNGEDTQGTTTPCLNDDSCNDDSKAVHPSLDSSLSTSDSKNKEETQGTTTPCLNDDSCNDSSKAVHPSLDSSLSTSDSKNKEDTPGTNHAADTNSNTGVPHNDPQGGTNEFFEPTVVAAIRLLGLACRIAIQHNQKIPQVIPLLVGVLQTAHDCSVPYAVQLASAYSLLEVSPWQPSRVVSVLEEWKIVQGKSNNGLPESLIQGLNSLKLCFQPSRDSSLLFENCARIEDHEDEG